MVASTQHTQSMASSLPFFTLISSPPPSFHHRLPPCFPPPPRLFLTHHPRLPPPKFSLSSTRSRPPQPEEQVFFDGGPHYGDLLSNLIFGFSLLWLPITLAAVFRGLFLRYRFTNLRVTVISGLTGDDHKDFSYSVIKDVKFVPRFIGAWGDVVITLTDETKVDLKCVPKFREISKYCLERAGTEEAKSVAATTAAGPKGFSS